jgi:hypothetical protein
MCFHSHAGQNGVAGRITVNIAIGHIKVQTHQKYLSRTIRVQLTQHSSVSKQNAENIIKCSVRNHEINV